jgi:hypothetical protein
MSSIGYIGHGQLESSPENFSILHVVSHELGHVQEFKNTAFRENADIAEIRVKINMEMRENGQLVAVSGETSATTKKRPEKDENDSLFKPYTNSDRFRNPKSNDSHEPNVLSESQELEKTKNMDSKKNIQELNLLSRKESLQSKLSQIENEIQNHELAPDPSVISFPTSNPRTEELEREKRKVQEEIRILKMQEDTKRNFQFLSQAQRDIMENAFKIGSADNSGRGSLLDVNS